MSMESKVNIVGSAKIKRNIYAADYDSFEIVKGKNENMIYNHFKSVFEIIKNSEIQLLLILNWGKIQKVSLYDGLTKKLKDVKIMV